jgi:peptidoglycan/LPS O-acetylase OafA/YrhL
MGPTWVADPALAVMGVVVVGFVITHVHISEYSPLAAFGRVSYSFFLLHAPIVGLIVSRVDLVEQLDLWGRFFFICVLAFPATLVFSILLYRFVELPSHYALRGQPKSRS